MGFFDSIKRPAHRREIDGNVVYLRSLTAAELNAWEPMKYQTDGDVFAFQHGVCDEHGAPLVPECTAEDLDKLPLNVRTEILVEIMVLTIPAKKSLLRSTFNSGDSVNGGESLSGNSNGVSAPSNSPKLTHGSADTTT